MITLDTHKLLHTLDVTPASHNIMLVGRHGIGKSEVLTSYYQQQGMQVVTLFLGQMSDPGDLIGLPVRDGGKTHFAPPYWFPTDDQPIVLFLDELNRARPEILQTIMDLALNRRLAGRSLPAGSRIIAAVNDGEEYQLTQLDPALVSRFNVYEFRPTVQEWLSWAEAHAIDPRIVAFISDEGSWLDGIQDASTDQRYDQGLEPMPDRRGWARVSDVIRPMTELTELDLDVIAGIVGTAAASRFYGSLSGHSLITGIQVLTDFEHHRAALSRYLLHQFSIVNESIFRHLELEGMADNYSGDDLMADTAKRYAANLTAYYDMLEHNHEDEALAHFINLFETGTYPKAILFMANHTPDLSMRMMNFIMKVD